MLSQLRQTRAPSYMGRDLSLSSGFERFPILTNLVIVYQFPVPHTQSARFCNQVDSSPWWETGPFTLALVRASSSLLKTHLTHKSVNFDLTEIPCLLVQSPIVKYQEIEWNPKFTLLPLSQNHKKIFLQLAISMRTRQRLTEVLWYYFAGRKPVSRSCKTCVTRATARNIQKASAKRESRADKWHVAREFLKPVHIGKWFKGKCWWKNGNKGLISIPVYR